MADHFNNIRFEHKMACFKNPASALQFLEEFRILNEITCSSCNRLMFTKIYQKESKQKVFLKCCNCTKKFPLMNQTIFKNTKVELHDLLFLLFNYIIDMPNNRLVRIMNISAKTYIEIKKKLNVIIRSINSQQHSLIGGNGIVIQIDETAICRGRLITNPSNAHDNIPNTTWLVGGVCETEEREFFLKIVPSRTADILYEVFVDNILINTIIRTDGYPSYPSSVRNFGSEHQIVLHTEGFTNSLGQHTNLIENFWTHLKTEMRSRYGIMRVKMEDFIEEFTFRKRNIKLDDELTVNRTFFLLLKNIFNFV